MVWKELLSLWHDDDSAMTELLGEFDDMLIKAKEMFSLCTSKLDQGMPLQSDESLLKTMDRDLNKLQQQIRRGIVTHISVQGTGDLIPCLQLMSLTKDAERIGDYCKNILEILQRSPKLPQDPLIPKAIEMRNKILIWFDQTKKAFDKMDVSLARATREESYFMEKECDQIVWSLSEDNQGRNAVSMAVVVRFFKRTAAHLGNICTSVSQPLDKLDYFQKPPAK